MTERRRIGRIMINDELYDSITLIRYIKALKGIVIGYTYDNLYGVHYLDIQSPKFRILREDEQKLPEYMLTFRVYNHYNKERVVFKGVEEV